MNQLNPTIAASLAGFMPRFAVTSCSQCGKDTGPGNAGVSQCSEHGQRTPAHTHVTTIGDGGAQVECRFDIDSDGVIETLQVWMGNTNIFKALTDKQVSELDAECLESAEADYRESKDDSRIDAYIADREYA